MGDSSEESDDSSLPPLIIDNGSQTIKAGFSGSSSPRVYFPNIVGRPRHQAVMIGVHEKEFYIGDEAQQRRGLLTLSYPMECGTVTDWDAMEKIWSHMFYNELRISPDECPLLLSEPPFTPSQNREKTTQIMFETFECTSMYIALQGVLSMYSSGRTSSLILDCGEGLTHVTPVHEGFLLPQAMQCLHFSGRDLTRYMMELLQQRNLQFSSTAEAEIARDVKENLCYVAPSYPHTSENPDEEPYMLPDGSSITVGREQFQCPEALFHPELIGMESKGVDELVNSSITGCDVEVASVLYRNIILCGGTTLLPGFAQRLKKEITSISTPGSMVGVVDPPERKFSVWIGGSILASLSSFDKMWISKEEYDEFGPIIVHRKCF